MNSNFDSCASYTKSLLILLVIWGHVFSQIPITYEHSALNLALYDTIYCFHMPLFVFISGWFTKKNTFASGLKKNLRIIRIYILLQIVYTIVTNGGGKSLLYPYPSLWYLIALFIYRSIIDIIPQNILNKAIFVISISSILSILIGCTIYAPLFEMMKIISFLPYFILGFYAHKRYHFLNNVTNMNKYIAYSIFIIVFAFVYIYGHPLIALTHRNVPYQYMSMSIIEFIFIKIMICAITLLLAYSFIAFYKHNDFLEKEGRNTLLYYIYHFPIIQFVIAPFFYKYQIYPNTISTLLITLFIFLFLKATVCKYPIFRTIIDPWSLLKH